MSRLTGQDIASKSLSDLESLVDQIPSITESGSQRSVQQQNYSVLGESLINIKLGTLTQQYYESSYGSKEAGSNRSYNLPLSQNNSYIDNHSNQVYNMSSRQQQQEISHSKAYTVENLALSDYAQSNSIGQPHTTYSNILSGTHYSLPASVVAENSSTNSYLISGLDSSLIQRSYPVIASHNHPSYYTSHYSSADAYSYNTSSYSDSFENIPSVLSPQKVWHTHTSKLSELYCFNK